MPKKRRIENSSRPRSGPSKPRPVLMPQQIKEHLDTIVVVLRKGRLPLHGGR